MTWAKLALAIAELVIKFSNWLEHQKAVQEGRAQAATEAQADEQNLADIANKARAEADAKPAPPDPAAGGLPDNDPAGHWRDQPNDPTKPSA